MPGTALSATLDARIATLSVEDAATIRKNPRSTILPPDAPVDSRQERALDLLEELSAGRSDPLRIARTLGEGGMGIVHLAEQTSMGRNVAVKTLRPGHRDHQSAMRLLREAWVTGSLEHPNIVPVYDVAVDASGAPQVVLKRIEGVDWASLLSDPAALKKRAEGDVEEWNIRTLLQVCNALAFAHDRGILHRDLKPENVMIGAFGEVYVVDWGIAVSLKEQENPRIPLARTATELAGTPAYMAPEMLTGDASQLSERTDVYLLGAMLFELFTGSAPHGGSTLHAIFEQVLASPPQIPANVPGEIASLCKRAMALEPGDRYATVTEFRKDLSGYLNHRESMRLARAAQQKLNALLEELGETESELDPAKVHHLFGECRFGFRAALDTCSTNDVARGGMRLAMKTMIDFEIRQGNLHDAQLLFGEFEDPPQDLKKRLLTLEKKQAEEAKHRTELAELEAQLDPTIGSRTRVFTMLVLGSLWTGLPMASHYVMVKTGMAVRPEISMYTIGLILPVVLGIGYWGRESLSKTVINRRLFGMIVLALVLQLVLGTALMIANVEPRAAVALNFFLWLTVMGVACINIDWRMWPGTLGYIVALFVSLKYLDYVLLIMGISHFVLTVNLVAIWRPMFESFEIGRRR